MIYLIRNNIVTYTIAGAAQPTVIVNASAAGNGAFGIVTTLGLTAADNGKVLSVTGISNGGGCSSSFTPINITLNVKGSGTWIRITSNWNDSQNWCGGVPVSTFRCYHSSHQQYIP